MTSSSWLRTLLMVLTQVGTPFFYIPVAIALAFANWHVAFRLMEVLILVELFCAALKFTYPKARPIPLPRRTLYQKYNAGSFPSIHTARLAAMSVFLATEYPKGAVMAAGLLSTLIVGYSRVYLQKHYPADVFAGAFIGAVLGVLLK